MRFYTLFALIVFSLSVSAETLNKSTYLKTNSKGTKAIVLFKGAKIAPKLSKTFKKQIEVSVRIRVSRDKLSGKYGTIVEKGTDIISLKGKKIGKFIKSFDALDTDKVLDGDKVLAIKGFVDRKNISESSFVENDLLKILSKKSSRSSNKHLMAHIYKFGYRDVGERGGITTYVLMDRWAYTMSPDPRVVLYVKNNELIAVVSTVIMKSKSFINYRKLDFRYHLGVLKKVDSNTKSTLSDLLSTLITSG